MLNTTPSSTKKTHLSITYPTVLHDSSVGMREEEEKEENGEECGVKKRRLSLEQVKELERSFEEYNRLEPEMKDKLAKELGLQPRQIAIWFQNRRARWKNKKLEREYEKLSVDYETLKLHFQDLQQDREKLVAEISQLRRKLGEENGSGDSRGAMTSFGEGNLMNFMVETDERCSVMIPDFGDLRDGSESECTGIDNSPQRTITDSDQFGPRLGYSGEGPDFGMQLPLEDNFSGQELLRSEEEHGFTDPDGTNLIMYGEEQGHVFPWYWHEFWT